MPDFANKYAATPSRKPKTSGASDEKIERKNLGGGTLREIYRNPAVNVAMTFMEVFPVGFAVTLIAAAVLRKRTPNASTAKVS